MDKVSKFLQKLSKSDYDSVMDVVEKITNREISDLDLKKLKGLKDTYRVRVGKYRIIFEYGDSRSKILRISNRDDNTYRF